MFSSNAPWYQFVEYGYENTEKRFCKISEELVVTFQTLSHGLHKSWFARRNYNGRKHEGGSVTTLTFGRPLDGGRSTRSGQSSVHVLSGLCLWAWAEQTCFWDWMFGNELVNQHMKFSWETPWCLSATACASKYHHHHSSVCLSLSLVCPYYPFSVQHIVCPTSPPKPFCWSRQWQHLHQMFGYHFWQYRHLSETLTKTSY